MHVGSLWIQPYTLRLVAGIIPALCWIWWQGPQRGFVRQSLVAWLWMIVCAALLAGRLGYVVDNRAYFIAHPYDVLRFHTVGGFHGTATWAGGLVVVWTWSRRSRHTFRELTDLLAPGALWAAAGAWWACAGVGCGAGREALQGAPALRWLVVDAPDLYYIVAPRYAVQIVAALGCLVLAVAATVSHWVPGKGWLFLCAYFVGSCTLIFLRDGTAEFLFLSLASMNALAFLVGLLHLVDRQRALVKHPESGACDLLGDTLNYP